MNKETLFNITIGFIGVLFFVSLISTLIVWLQPSMNPNGNGPNGDDNEQITIIINEYRLYEDERLNFRFILADITMTATQQQQVTMNKFVTSQQVRLDQVSVYLEDLKELGIDIAQHDVDFDIDERTNNIDLKLFVPLRINESSTLTVYFQGDEEVIFLFDLSKNNDTIEGLINMDPNGDDDIIDQIVVDDLYRIKIIDVTEIAYKEILETLPDGSTQEMVLPSTAKLIGVRLNIESLGNQPIIVEAARFRIVEENQTALAFDKTIKVTGFHNIVSQEVYNTADGFVFFDIYSTDESFIRQLSEFEFKLNVSDQWIRRRVIE